MTYLEKDALRHGENTRVRLNDIPDECPLCHMHIVPTFRFVSVVANDIEIEKAEAAFECTNSRCQELFIATFAYLRSDGHKQQYLFESSAPCTPKLSSFAPVVTELSPSFERIFNQSEAAKAHGLDELVGIGLRKALEFLIKDYAISQCPEKKGEILGTHLGPCISNYVSDAKIRECAKRAAWLGNDETHYERKWESKDVKDLENLVTLTVNWIHNEILTRQYLDEM